MISERVAGVFLCLAAAFAPAAAIAQCEAPRALMSLGPALGRAAARVERGEALTILAIGSSSTQGVGATSPQASYPSRLEAELKARFPGRTIRVINRGVGGEDAPEELARLGQVIAADQPDLVIWQVGTNAVLRRDDLAADHRIIEDGVQFLKRSDVDVLLMDLQFAPRVLERPSYPEMERVIGDVARQEHVGFFRRFEIMRDWSERRQFDPAPRDPSAMIGDDGLHMTDASYACLAIDLAQALDGNWRSWRLVQGPAARRSSHTVAGLDRTAAPASP